MSKGITKEEPKSRGKLGRPRDITRDEVIINITLNHLTEFGYSNLSTTKIAQEAKVSKATIYRRWSSKKYLVIDAFKTLEELIIPNTGNLEGDLRDLISQLLFLFTKTNVLPVLQILTGEMVNDKELSEELSEWIQQRYYPARAVLEKAIQRGELPKATNLEIAEMVVVGPLLASVFYSKTKITPAFIDQFVEKALRGLLGK
ncbi:MAG: TetR/AcrR family transcriptional regulator [SAR86 cluster bacterium]|nr:TetR/AcrR family transcriptional regulator [SAR86 cluster bacterium]